LTVKAVSRTPGDCGNEIDNAAMRNHAVICTGLRTGTTPRFSVDDNSRTKTHSVPLAQAAIWTITIPSICPDNEAVTSRSPLNFGGPVISARKSRLSSRVGAGATREAG